ncbi:hypothetical protein FRACYDRAFT_237314 [Fragilariopsis cylindrus CCMP1102]|uniref:Uncharacterized protein n=1 Tax=Fragilariopsis cylindrus CCMP1102 TaxID=635003 RepID=A0A1E7FLI3_9STRA|nr:hypothetical protein FRACYDRAFT_237314 [Fragilariopsis cylindrus CCMP1102]|eukprot:OEU19020.1 hypothetical protein FRACYDRAFT_237314 [Fragilariopsis cylindrus CCMP1102]
MNSSHDDRYSVVVLDWPKRETNNDIECYCIPSTSLEDHAYYNCNINEDPSSEEKERREADSPSSPYWKRLLTRNTNKKQHNSQDDVDWSATGDQPIPWRQAYDNNNNNNNKNNNNNNSNNSNNNNSNNYKNNSNNYKYGINTKTKKRSNIINDLVQVVVEESREDIDDAMSTLSYDSCWYYENKAMVELMLPNVLFCADYNNNNNNNNNISSNHEDEYHDVYNDEDRRDDGGNNDSWQLLFPSYAENVNEETTTEKEETRLDEEKEKERDDDEEEDRSNRKINNNDKVAGEEKEENGNKEEEDQHHHKNHFEKLVLDDNNISKIDQRELEEHNTETMEELKPIDDRMEVQKTLPTADNSDHENDPLSNTAAIETETSPPRSIDILATTNRRNNDSLKQPKTFEISSLYESTNPSTLRKSLIDRLNFMTEASLNYLTPCGSGCGPYYMSGDRTVMSEPTFASNMNDPSLFSSSITQNEEDDDIVDNIEENTTNNNTKKPSIFRRLVECRPSTFLDKRNGRPNSSIFPNKKDNPSGIVVTADEQMNIDGEKIGTSTTDTKIISGMMFRRLIERPVTFFSRNRKTNHALVEQQVLAAKDPSVTSSVVADNDRDSTSWAAMSIQSIGDWTATNDTLDESTGSTNNNSSWGLQSSNIVLDNHNPCNFPDILVEEKNGDIVETDDDSSNMGDSFSSVTTVAIFEDDNEDDKDDDVENPLSDELLLLINNEPKSSIDGSNEKNSRDEDRWSTTEREDLIIGIDVNWVDPIDDGIIEEKDGDNVLIDDDASNVVGGSFSPTTTVKSNDVGQEEEEEEEEEEQQQQEEEEEEQQQQEEKKVECHFENRLLNNNEAKLDEGTLNAQDQSIVKMLENKDDSDDVIISS